MSPTPTPSSATPSPSPTGSSTSLFANFYADGTGVKLAIAIDTGLIAILAVFIIVVIIQWKKRTGAEEDEDEKKKVVDEGGSEAWTSTSTAVTTSIAGAGAGAGSGSVGEHELGGGRQLGEVSSDMDKGKVHHIISSAQLDGIMETEAKDNKLSGGEGDNRSHGLIPW